MTSHLWGTLCFVVAGPGTLERQGHPAPTAQVVPSAQDQESTSLESLIKRRFMSSVRRL